MSDRLFDPAKMKQADVVRREREQAADAPLTVSQLAGKISHALITGLPQKVRVIGEISGFRERTHWYFDLKDAGAVVNCAMFATQARRVRFTPRNGQEVVVTGRVEFYDKQGKVSLLIEKIEPVGAGALELAFQALCEELRGLGWFDPARKRPIPSCPKRVAVVTSRSAAALQDVLDTMKKRCPSTQVQLVDVRVQGDGAAEEVAGAVRWLGTITGASRPEVILVTRGGGSMEDLWAFNERIVAEAIVASAIPVVAAIGHETDTTIAELVADLRCATPTQAAMRLTPDRRSLIEQLDSLERRLHAAVVRGTRDRRRRVVAAAKHPFFADPWAPIERERRHVEALAKHLRGSGAARVRNATARLERLAGKLEAFRPAAMQARRGAVLDSASVRLTAAIRARLASEDVGTLEERLGRGVEVALERAEQRLLSLARQLDAVGPESVLRRGYSYTLKPDGSLVRSVGDVAGGDAILTRLSDGEVRSVVTEGGAARPSAEQIASRPSRRSKKAVPRDQMDLFRADQ
jgi:exodeoxyribonuclease VII large subunit